MGKPRGQLTLKQRKFVEKTVETLNPTEAARIAYPDSKHPDVVASINMNKLNIQEAIEAELVAAGIPRKVILDRLGKIILNPQSKLDGISVSAANLVGKWAGWEAGTKKLDMPDIPKTAEEIDIMLIRMRKNQQKSE